MRDADGFGACQLPEETNCTLDSDCHEPLVCRDRECTNACEDDRDCPPGSVCGEDETGALGCRDDAEFDCQINSDCAEPLVCAVDHRCRVQCRVSRDCPSELVCADWLDPPRCVGPEAGRPDAGTDTGTPDAGTLDAGMDTGTPDAGTLDAGMDTGTATLDSGVPDTGTAAEGGVDAGGVPSGASGIDNLVAGFGHGCAALTASDLRCWGDDSSSQLGDGMTGSRPSPFSLSLTGVERLAAGNGHSCAATTGGLFCWGDNRRGQVGVGSGAATVRSPSRVSGVGGVVDLAAGRDHMCALTTTQVLCWGANDRGQLGDGTTTDRVTPTAVVGLSASVAALAARGTHTCALLSSGGVQCWGDDSFGQLGDGRTTTAGVPRPVDVIGLAGIIGITAGTGFSCALNGSGKVTCWGDGGFGQLGDGTVGVRTAPGATVLLNDVVQVAGGVRHVCALTNLNKVFCWGDNGASQLGRAVGAPFTSSTPLEVTGVGAPLEVAAGQSHGCVRNSGGIRCWGTNTLGQLGDGTRAGSTIPVNVSWP